MKTKQVLVFLGIMLGILSGAASLWAQIELTDIKGNKLQCEIKEATPGAYTLVSAGRTFKVTDKDLSEASRSAAVAYAKDKGVFKAFPAVDVEVMVATKRNQGGAWYIKIMDIEPKISLAGSSKLAQLPKAKATMVILTMNTKEKYIYKTEVLKVQSAQTLDIPPGTGEKRYFEFKASKVSYDSYRDESNVGGEVYKYYIFGLMDAESGDIVDFQTNYLDLKKLVELKPDARARYLAFEADSKFPEKLE